ncbi:MAG: hypothetical protein D6720_05125, partial [Gammaproteobacteria bacterium]
APDNADVLFLKGLLASVEGKGETAEQVLQQVFEKAPNTKTMLALARQQWAIGQPESALALQEQWVKEHPDDVVANLALSATLVKEGQTDRALERLKAVLETDPKNVIALNDLAWYLKDKDPQQALDYARRAAELAPDAPQVLDTLAMVQLAAGQVDKAGDTMARALLKSPGSPSLIYHRALIEEKKGNLSKAVELLESALKKSSFPEKADAERLLPELKAQLAAQAADEQG